MGFTACNLGVEIWQEEQEQERNLTGCSGMHKVIGAWLIVGVTRGVRCDCAASNTNNISTQPFDRFLKLTLYAINSQKQQCYGGIDNTRASTPSICSILSG